MIITKDALSDAVYDTVGDELMYEIREDLVEALLKKYVLLERPDVGVVTENGEHERIYLDGRKLYPYPPNHWKTRLEEATGELEDVVREYEQCRIVVAFYEDREGDAKHKRREEISKEMGHPVYMYAPDTIKTLIARLVDEEFKNAG